MMNKTAVREHDTLPEYQIRYAVLSCTYFVSSHAVDIFTNCQITSRNLPKRTGMLPGDTRYVTRTPVSGENFDWSNFVFCFSASNKREKRYDFTRIIQTKYRTHKLDGFGGIIRSFSK